METGKYGLPLEVKFCSRCVISNQRPSSTVELKNNKTVKKETIHFDEEGVCDACRFAEYKDSKIDWEAREKLLVRLCDKYRSKDGSYDCLVPGSGGKDSGFASHILKYKYGMNPLTVTWAPHWYTDIGWKNMSNWSRIGGFDNFLFTPNGRVHALLTRLAFVNLLHPFQPFIIGQRGFAAKMAKRFGLNLVFYGENQAEYGNKMSENDTPVVQPRFYTQNTRSLNDLYLGGVSVTELVNTNTLSLNDLNPYMPLLESDAKGLDVHYLSYYLKWDPQENFYYAAKHTGFEANTERTQGSYSKYSSIDDRIDYFHYFTTLIKFGLGRASYDAAQEIRNKKITREEGVTLVRRFDQEFPSNYFKDFLEYVQLDEEEFWKLINAGRPDHLWKQEGGEWKLLHQVE